MTTNWARKERIWKIFKGTCTIIGMVWLFLFTLGLIAGFTAGG